MNKMSQRLTAAVMFACALLCACDSHVDLDHIDPAVKLEMGLALPIGEVSATIGDFLGSETVRQITINEEGTYQFEDTVSFSRRFHDLDLSSYEAIVNEELDVYDQVQGYALVGGITYTLDWPITVEWTDLNSQLRKERIDSMSIRDAKFVVKLDQNFDIEFDRIKKIELILSDDFTRPAGKTIELPIGSYGTETEIHVDNFNLCMMQDRTLPASGSNVKNTVSFTLRFKVRLNDGEVMTLQPGAAFQTFVKASLLDYEALYGYFLQSEEMMESDTLSISELWGAYHKIRQVGISLTEPEIDLSITTPVAAALRCKIANLRVENKDHSKKREADFNGSKVFEATLPNYVRVTDPIGATATNTLHFDNENSGLGHLTEIHPEYLYYDYSIVSDIREGMDQQRLAQGMNYVDCQAAFRIPFKFNEGIRLEYKDTASVNFEEAQMSKWLADVEMVDSISVRSLHLMLTIHNSLPFAASATVRFLDANYQELELNALESKTVRLDGPSELQADGTLLPGKAALDIAISDETLAMLPQIKYIEYDVAAADSGAPASVYPARITPEQGLLIKIGLTADAAAYLKLNMN